MRICTVVGARPQFVKASVVSRAIGEHKDIVEEIVHTGQHYDAELSEVFFGELGIPGAVANLEVGSGTHATQTGRIMMRLESWLVSRTRYDWVLVYGDTNSTLAAAMVASKLGIPLAHVEAGLRSFVTTMPEEINRVVTDRLSDLLLCPTPTAVRNLEAAGVFGHIVETGDVMFDATRIFRRAAAKARLPDSIAGLARGTYSVATVHRPENTDDAGRMASILSALERLDVPVVFVAHPRVRPIVDARPVHDAIRVVDPLGYLQMMRLVDDARFVVTDSGGLQKEAYWLGTPCITLRNETEWVETLVNGWNQLAGCDTDAIVSQSTTLPGPGTPRPEFGRPPDSTASARVVAALVERTP